MIEHEEDGLLVETANEKQLSLVLERLMSDEVLRRRLGEQAVRRAAVDFSTARFESGLVESLSGR